MWPVFILHSRGQQPFLVTTCLSCGRRSKDKDDIQCNKDQECPQIWKAEIHDRVEGGTWTNFALDEMRGSVDGLGVLQ